MKKHYCKEEKEWLIYEGECNWCGEKEYEKLKNEEILKLIHNNFVKFGFESDYIVEDVELIVFAREIEALVRSK